MNEVATTALDRFSASVDSCAVAVVDHHLSHAFHFFRAHATARGRSLELRLICIMVILFIVLKFNEKNHIVGFRVAHNDVVFIDNSEDNDAIA